MEKNKLSIDISDMETTIKVIENEKIINNIVQKKDVFCDMEIADIFINSKLEPPSIDEILNPMYKKSKYDNRDKYDNMSYMEYHKIRCKQKICDCQEGTHDNNEKIYNIKSYEYANNTETLKELKNEKNIETLIDTVNINNTKNLIDTVNINNTENLIDLKCTGPIIYQKTNNIIQIVDIKLCFNHETGEKLDFFYDRFNDTFHIDDEDVDDILYKCTNSKQYLYYLYRTDFSIYLFSEIISENIKDKIVKHIPTDRYFEKHQNNWIECKEKEAYNIINKYINTFLTNMKIGIVNKKLINYIDEKILEWNSKKITNKLTNEFVIESILGITYSINFNLFSNGEIELENGKKSISLGLNDIDNIDFFINSCLSKTKNDKDNFLSSYLYSIYKKWCETNNYKILDIRKFGRELNNHKIKNKHTRNGTTYFCIKIKN